MNILSLFDGISCGMVALRRAGIHIDNYYASEIDKYAIQISKKNHPNIIHLGDITQIESLPDKIDIVIGGSPCQGFSFAGKKLNFNDTRSVLFFEFVRLLKECKPRYFLLENVKMKKESQDIITQHLGVEPVEINSALVSAQNRKRLYWTNIPNVTQPADKGILLKDIVEPHTDVDRNKSYCIDASYHKGASYEQYKSKNRRKLVCNHVGTATNINGIDCIKRIYSQKGKSPTLSTCQGGHREPKIAIDIKHWRKLTPTECERLQTLPDGYTEGVSNTQRYKMLGNGWTVDVIAHILKGIHDATN